MNIVSRLIGGVLGLLASFPAGMALGCGVYESTGPDYRQCGYEFEGMGYVLVAIAVLAVFLAYVGQWLGGWLWRRLSERDG